MKKPGVSHRLSGPEGIRLSVNKVCESEMEINMKQKIKEALEAAVTATVMLALILAAGCSDIALPEHFGPAAWAAIGLASAVGLMWFVKNDC